MAFCERTKAVCHSEANCLREPSALHAHQPQLRGYLGVKKILLFPETWTKKIGSVGRVFFYNGASKYTKLLHTFLSLLSSSYIVL